MFGSKSKKDETERETLIAEAKRKGVTFSKRGTMAEIRQEIKEHDEMQRMKDSALASRKLAAEKKKVAALQTQEEGRATQEATEKQVAGILAQRNATTPEARAKDRLETKAKIAAYDRVNQARVTELIKELDSRSRRGIRGRRICAVCTHRGMSWEKAGTETCHRYPQELKLPAEHWCGEFRSVPVAPEPAPQGRRGRP